MQTTKMKTLEALLAVVTQYLLELTYPIGT